MGFKVQTLFPLCLSSTFPCFHVAGLQILQKLIEALEGLEMKEGYDFPQGDKTLRKEDHQAFVREFIYEVSGGTYHIKDVVSKDKTIVPAACQFAA